MKNVAIINLFVMLLVGISTNSSAQTKLINPHAPNSYVDSYILADSTVRIIGSEPGSNKGLFFIDKFKDGAISEPFFFPEAIGDVLFNFAGVDCKILPLKSGDFLLAINQFDCDYAPFPSLARFNEDGEVIWARSMDTFYFYYAVQKLTLVDSNIICMTNDELDTLYFDLDGNEAVVNASFIIYDTVIAAPIGFFAFLGKDLFHLDERFDVVDVVSLDNVIRTISLSGDSLVLVSTSTSLIILDPNLDLIIQSDYFADFDLVTSSADWLWVSQLGGDIIQLDYLLQAQDTFQMNKDIQLRSMVVLDEVMSLSGNYLAATGPSLFFHTTDVDQFRFDIKKDIALESIRIQEPVFYDFEPFAVPWGFNIPYRNVVVTVSNTGQDTIRSLTILYNAGSGCFFCDGEVYRWTFDALSLYPGMQMDVSLPDFSAWCITQSPSTFCLSIFPADSLPETDQLNNRLCIEVDAFLSGVNGPQSSTWSISPNPATDFITVRFDGSLPENHQGAIFNGIGELVESFELQEDTGQIDLVDYLPGMYFLQIRNTNGGFLSKKFAVLH